MYLEEGLFARCVAYAVDSWTRGYSRTSDSVHLTAFRAALCRSSHGLVASLTSHEGFSGQPEVGM